MSDTLDWNAKTIAEFRANEGRVGGNFKGAPLVLVHHRGRTTGREYVTPMMYLPHDTDPDIIYVFATKAGAPANPDWYHNLTAAGDGSVERGTKTYKVTVRELAGAERDRIYAEQARRYPGFAGYARQIFITGSTDGLGRAAAGALMGDGQVLQPRRGDRLDHQRHHHDQRPDRPHRPARTRPETASRPAPLAASPAAACLPPRDPARTARSLAVTTAKSRMAVPAPSASRSFQCHPFWGWRVTVVRVMRARPS